MKKIVEMFHQCGTLTSMSSSKSSIFAPTTGIFLLEDEAAQYEEEAANVQVERQVERQD